MYDKGMRREFEHTVLELCHETVYPILANADIAYTDPLLTIPLMLW